MEQSELNKRAWALWGKDTQFLMLIEECTELIQSIAKLDGKRNGSSVLVQVAGEIADVEICINQIKQMIPGMNNAVYQNTKLKLLRLEQLLDSEVNNG